MLAWERQPEETARAYEAFVVYRDLGPARSLAKVGQALGKSTGLMERWSRTHEWVARVEALEARDEMLRREAIEEHESERARDLEERRLKLREKLLENGEKAAEQEALMLSWPLVEQRFVRPDPDDPDKKETVILVPARWTKGTAKQLHDIASRAAGEPEKVALTTPDGLGQYEGGGDSLEDARAKVARIIQKIALEPKEDSE